LWGSRTAWVVSIVPWRRTPWVVAQMWRGVGGAYLTNHGSRQLIGGEWTSESIMKAICALQCASPAATRGQRRFCLAAASANSSRRSCDGRRQHFKGTTQGVRLQGDAISPKMSYNRFSMCSGNYSLSLWRPRLPNGYSCKSSCARPG